MLESKGYDTPPPDAFAVWRLDPAKYDPTAEDGCRGGALEEAAALDGCQSGGWQRCAEQCQRAEETHGWSERLQSTDWQHHAQQC